MQTETTPSGLHVPKGTVQPSERNDARAAMLRQQEGLSKLEKHFPAILDLAFALAARLNAYANMKRIEPAELKFSKVLWHNDGTITFKVTHKGKGLTPGEVHLV